MLLGWFCAYFSSPAASFPLYQVYFIYESIFFRYISYRVLNNYFYFNFV